MREGVAIFAVVMIGTLAGILACSGMDQLAMTRLQFAEWLAFRGFHGVVFPAVMPWIFNGTLLLLLIAAVLARGSGRWSFVVAAVMCAAAIFVTVRVEVPINHRIDGWTTASPADWTAVRNHWLRKHLVRTISGMPAFVAAVTGLAKM